MADETGISWADSTFNPWIGCEKVSPACAHCYAETLVTGRMGRPGTWGADGVRALTSDGLWRRPVLWERDAAQFAEEHDGRRRRVFCASLADVFEPRPELEPWRRELFALIEQTPSLDWLLLTKRPDVAREWMLRYYVEMRPLEMHDEAGALWSHTPSQRVWVSRDDLGWGILPNVWIGASVENTRWTWRADALREIPAAVRFLSCEPLLGDLFPPVGDPALDEAFLMGAPDDVISDGIAYEMATTNPNRVPLNLDGIDWVIGGGESGGRDSRPTQIEWAYKLRDACIDAAVPFHWKQWGSYGEDGAYQGRSPKASGKTVEGVDWCEFPATGMRVGA